MRILVRTGVITPCFNYVRAGTPSKWRTETVSMTILIGYVDGASDRNS